MLENTNFDVTIHNIGDQDKTLTYETNLQTDAVEDGELLYHHDTWQVSLVEPYCERLIVLRKRDYC